MHTILGAAQYPRYRWNQRFETWACPLSDSEDQRCQNAENVIRAALDVDPTLSRANLLVFAQGSYRANTNIRADSDIDICVCHQDVFFAQYPAGTDMNTFGNSGAGLKFSDFKNQVGYALQRRFGITGVTRGAKSFKVHANTYRIDADVVPVFEYRWYYLNNGIQDHLSGIKFISDAGASVINWPEQTYQNGVDKNRATGWKYKQVVRILKNLRGEMQAANIQAAKDFPSFLIESLVWNVADNFFDGDDLYDIVNKVVLDAWYNTYDEGRCKKWTEVNGIKYLFSTSQPWTRIQANNFLWAVREFVGFSNS